MLYLELNCETDSFLNQHLKSQALGTARFLGRTVAAKGNRRKPSAGKAVAGLGT